MNKTLLILILLSSAWGFSASLQAETKTWKHGTFLTIGHIGAIKRETIILDDITYRLSPTAKFSTAENNNASLSLLKANQKVGYKLIMFNNRFLVDHLWLIPENEWSLYRK
ncbi:MAG: hypothetical protein OEY09_20195 [Gammaproteobacteria bacterium]|nr:hypothetical protein [Gammaproteobacteria bacterium]